MISIKDLKQVYFHRGEEIIALNQINLNINQGEIFGIIGRSGAGKSTLMRCMNRLERPKSGSIIIDGQDLVPMNNQALQQSRKKIGMIFQNFNLMNSRTVFENVAFPLELVHASPREIELAVMPLLEMVGLSDKTHAYPQHLSGGQKQRVGIARALINKPKVLLCDEATSSLDPQTTQSILALLRDINEKLNLTIVIITHDLEAIKSVCQRVAVLHQGSIVEEANLLDFFTNPKSDIAKEFIKSSTRLEMPIALRRQLKGQYQEMSTALLRLSFTGQTAQDSVITAVIQHFGVNINILQAHIENIANQRVGIMVIELIGDQFKINQSIEFFRDKALNVEVLGYVPRVA